jgi:hypothetical protein
MNSESEMNGRKRPRPVSRNYAGICLEEQSKAKKVFVWIVHAKRCSNILTPGKEEIIIFNIIIIIIIVSSSTITVGLIPVLFETFLSGTTVTKQNTCVYH